ncbi:hypothetical protein P152DRAFT_405822 [Eremomyces bilateralis CBS 781.70]|uniref:1-phosphatidylinositol 4-kinase n=1 Tax=Eremomyces bilateralis CBS 781.70 TaxID=1392243 RepID=A0A6G1FRA0_9PEZI|nr:uncharacterized protein P152DRAFT_405822 [Eremomyces bilateralis CBS 781.70]KAF1808258.1 hypothetical protein P152DRAFT_405822 [Eremomyces bilateralis CBS 781.70]
MSWQLLERFIESDHFNNDPSLSVAYLSRYADHVGIHYVLCSKLRQFSYEEIEFYLPQLCHLLVSVDNESMALEEFITDLCEESVNSALLTFWLFQTYLHDLSANPQSPSFKSARRIYNRVQRIVFGGSDSIRRDRIKENILPVSVLASLVLATTAAPFLAHHAGPLAIGQARKPRPVEDMIEDPTHVHQAPQIRRSQTVSEGPSRPRKPRPPRVEGLNDSDQRRPRTMQNGPVMPVISSPRKVRTFEIVPRSSSAILRDESRSRLNSPSLPDVRAPKAAPMPTPPASAGLPLARLRENLNRRHSHAPRPLTPSSIPRPQRIRMLRSNYFRSETAFLTALEDISIRLVAVPKPARLSALRAELALIAQDLPAEVDIPLICPASLIDGSASKSLHHRIVRINPAEATSLNSAERVPYLLMMEVLRDDLTFDPDTEENKSLLNKLMVERSTTRRRLFDTSDALREVSVERTSEPKVDSVFEPENGDLGSSSLLRDPEESSRPRIPYPTYGYAARSLMPRSSSGNNTANSNTAHTTPRTSSLENSRSSSPLPRRITISGSRNTTDAAEVSALATHMRTAAQMLAQLNTSGSKRPRAEIEAIQSRIIASMQNLEEQNFSVSEPGSNPSPIIERIISNHALESPSDALDFEDSPDPNSASGAGAARMENDQKTGGLLRNGDRDDPSAATVGEDWASKRERIRRSSPYGWMANWDLVSVIVKTGADLRQEAFACQLISVCAKIWADAGVDVWVKRMRILVTGESSGLIETITNGVSLHSLKRSLTLASIAAGKNPRKGIATLPDHFAQAFGDADGEAYGAAVDAFKRSLAAYSVISYVLLLKDRHNGNILIDNAGHVIHIDFGFMLSNSPGNMGFETAAFKLTQEYVDVLGGVGSPAFEDFKALCREAFLALRKEADRIIMLVEMMGRQSKMPCYAVGVAQVVGTLKARFALHLSRDEVAGFVDDLVAKSNGNYFTRLYDTFQYRTQGIY